EIAKFRAARTIWAEVMRDRFRAGDERSLRLRTHAQTAGCSLTWKQPYNNIVRTALQGLAAVLGGTQSLHTNSLDEAYALPSQEAATIALRTQQIIAHESGVPAVADPLGGSYLVENLTQEIMNRANQYIRRIDEMGGMIPAIERGYPQAEIANASYEYQRAVETGVQKIVGVNAFYTEQKEPLQLLQIDDSPAKTQRERLAKVRSERDAATVTQAIDALKRCAESDKNTTPFILDAVR